MNNQAIQFRQFVIDYTILRTVSIVAFLVVAVASFPVIADPTSMPSETVEGVFGEGTTGQGQPDSKTGTMTWTYPFDLPSARGGPQPKLALHYNSSTKDREAGYGWGLDLPVIERKPLSGNPCFDKNDGTPIPCGYRNMAKSRLVSEERYTYNGQPLVFICFPPASFNEKVQHCGNELQPDWITSEGWRYFRLQVEGQFARFYLSPDRKYWRVQLKGGELLEFGEPHNSSTPGVEHPFDNKKAILRWRLVRHSDFVHKVSGAPINYVDYRWKRLGKRGLLYLTDIYDTPRATGQQSDADFAHHTQLTWNLPVFRQSHYADPHRATPDLRLTHVAVASMPWSGSASREIIRIYRLSYAPVQQTSPTVLDSFGIASRFQLWQHSFLTKIQMDGNCKELEYFQEIIPTASVCQSRLPPTTFWYQGVQLGIAVAPITKVKSDPPNAIEKNNVLPYLNTVGIVDFNRDGLPDIVQGWDAEFCPGEDGDEDAIHESIQVSPSEDALVCLYRGPDGTEARNFQSSRPLIGYLNRGMTGGAELYLAAQCMDAGRIGDTTGITKYNAGHIPGFFSNKGATTLLGSWGEGLAAWSNAGYAFFRARPKLPVPDSKSGEYAPGSGCDAGNFNEANFHPGWEWKMTQYNVDWAKPPAAFTSHERSQPRWFADVDGDGLLDRFSSAQPALEFYTAYVEFTRRYGKNVPLPGGGKGPAQIPFDSDLIQYDDIPHSLAPSEAGAKRGTKYYYVDINGDSLVDLVTYNPNDGGGVPRVRPGNGYGEFTCIQSLQPWQCKELPSEPSAIYEIQVLESQKPWPFNDDTFFHDVTGDGLADIVKYDMSTGKIFLWFNQDGHTFACASEDCFAGFVVDGSAGTFDIGNHRTTFADMNADGTDDIVILTKKGAYIGSFMNTSPFQSNSDWAPKAGLLTRIDNGYGATTEIQYKTIQQLDLLAAEDPRTAWRYHSPVVENVVTQVVTQDSSHTDNLTSDLPAPYKFKRKAQYFYQNPAYDRWSRSFAGFRKVGVRYGDESAMTVSTHWFGPCQNNELNARLPGAVDIPLCQDGSDDDIFKALAGVVVRIDRGNFSSLLNTEDDRSKLLWTKIFNYANYPLSLRIRGLVMADFGPYHDPGGDRNVWFAYPSFIETYLYDETKPRQPGGTYYYALGGDPIEKAPHQKDIRKHTLQKVDYDDKGNLIRTTDWGAIKDDDSKPTDEAEPTTTTLFTSADPSDSAILPGGISPPPPLSCTSEWQCKPNYVSIWELTQIDRFGEVFANLLRKSHFSYTENGDVQYVDGWLDAPIELLNRHHPAGISSTAPQTAGQSRSRGWHRLAILAYDAWGNVIQTASGQSADGSIPGCTSIGYDTPYQHLPSSVRNYTEGCDGPALETQSVFDRGFQKVVSRIAPNGSFSEIHYDPFGRPIEVFLPNPDVSPDIQKPVSAATITYSDRKPLSYVDVKRNVGFGKSIRSISILNGLGEPVIAFDQGDNNDWILNGWKETNLSGQLKTVRRPWVYTGDPITVATKASPLSIPNENSLFEINYDGFGRKISIKETSPPDHNKNLVRTSYFPLAIETRDAEQLKPGGSHEKAFQRVEFDGRGRTTKSVQHIGNPTADDIVTTVEYEPTGEPCAITRSHGGNTYQRTGKPCVEATQAPPGDIYQRTMKYDTLGRLMVNKEPNTGNNWRYAWDDAGRLVGTSDARGCGENFFYDGLNRLIGEDYSPCLTSQAAYTPPNPLTGEGLETFYRYDKYEADQVSPDSIFKDDPSFALGKLIAVSDRGSHTRFSYDARDRVRRISRQLAKPDGVDTKSQYAPHWYTSRMDYDLGDRVTRRTTGVDIADLLIDGSSEESYKYSERGLPASIDSSYGHLVENIAYDSDGLTNNITYGDHSGMTASFEYDNRRRLTRYSLATSSLDTLMGLFPLTYFDYHFPSYDEAGNPLEIEDASDGVLSSTSNQFNFLPPEAAPVQKRKMEYDDLYRLTTINNTYNVPGGIAPWRSPFDPEISTGNRHPVPLRSLPTRVTQQTFDYDGLGNLTASSDDLKVIYDRSLGSNLGYGTQRNGPNQLQTGEGLQVRYDEAGNLAELKLQRPGNCPTGSADQCAQWFAYDWDEVGQLARARRWDYDGNALPSQDSPSTLPTSKPSWDLSYAYSQGARVRKTVTDAAQKKQHTLEIFDTLRVEQASFNSTNGDYKVGRENVHAYPGGMAHVFWDTTGQLPHQASDSSITMYLNFGDHLGSSSVVLNHATSELVERTTYLPYGAVESDYRPTKGKAFREPYKFTGKEEDIEVGATYFGARYYQPYLGRFLSADPLTIHGLGSDLNPYAYVGSRVMTNIDLLGLCGGGYAIASGTVTYEYDCSQQSTSNSDRQESHAQALTSQEGNQQQTSIVSGSNSQSETKSSPSYGVGNALSGDPPKNLTVANAALFSSVQAALYVLDPLHVNRSFIKNVLTSFDKKASPLSRSVSGASAVLSVLPVLGEANILFPPGALGNVANAARSSEELAAEVLSIRLFRGGQTVSVLETAEGVRLVGGGKADLSPLQRIYASLVGLMPVKLAGTHAEPTVIIGALNRGLTPVRGVTTQGICWVCERDITEGAYGVAGEAVEGAKTFSFPP